MIGQKPKPLEEILESLEGKQKVVVVGCGGCATVFHTGGEAEVQAMAERLTQNGKEVLAAVAPPFGEFTCYAPWSKARLGAVREQVEECDAILMLTCGDGAQVVRELVVEGAFGIRKPLYPGDQPYRPHGRRSRRCSRKNACSVASASWAGSPASAP